MILIITNKEDVHPNPVIEILSRKDIPFFRLNAEALLTDYEFAWWNDSRGCDFRIRCTRNGLEARGSEITAIWDRRPEQPKELPVKSTPEIDKHNIEEALGFLVFLRYYLKDILSIGSIAGDRPAASKMLQYRVAHQVGFSLPESCYSNRKEDVLRLAAEYDSLILKPIESNDIWDETQMQDYVFYSQKVPSASLDDVPDEAFSQTVTFAQNYVEKDFELRITVVGDKVFACKIDSQKLSDDTGKIDWRQGYKHGMKQTAFDLPENIARKCREYLGHLDLNFGCFDFIVTPSGDYVFLECNPNGQWLWVEDTTGLKISEAITDFLSSPKVSAY